jgi:PAS domain-containing protein
MVLNYAPSIIFFSLVLIHEKESSFYPSKFWGWVFSTGQTTLWALQGYWMSIQAVLTLFFLVQRTLSLPKNHPARKQVSLIAYGFSVPVILGIATEVILPALDNQTAIPITTTFLTCFSFATFRSISKYRLFNVNESLKIPTIMNALTDILIVMDSDGVIRYINRQGSEILGMKRSELIDKQLSTLLAGKETEWARVHEELVTPSLRGKK